MRFFPGISPVVSRRLLIGVFGAAALVSGGCAPDEVQAPQGQAEIETAEAPTTGLIGEWKLDETGGTTAADTKNGYNASVLGGAAFVAGKLGNGLNLNNGTAGTGGKYAQMPSNTTLNDVQEGDYTISAWFYPHTIPTDASIDNRHWAVVVKASPHMGILYNSAGKFLARHYLTDGAGKEAKGDAVYPAGDWYHVAGTVSKTAGTVKIYINGALQDEATFTPDTPAKDYGSTPFQIGRSGTFWAANGKVDQVRLYNVALSDAQIVDLYNETEAPAFRFPVGMSKGTQTELLGMPHTPDGFMTGQSENSINNILATAKESGARVTIRVTGGNGNFYTNPPADSSFDITKWKNAFNQVRDMQGLDGYLADGTLIGHYAIDEPFADFDGMTSGLLEQICQHQKEAPGWQNVPCIIREKNTKLHEHAPAGGYQYVDAGWAQLAHHHYMPPSPYAGDMGAYFRDNLAKGNSVGVGLMYGFNLFNGRRVPDCAQPDGDPPHCAMTAAEVRELADSLAAIGDDQGCGVMGYRINSNPDHLEYDYFYGEGMYSGNGIQSALQYLNSKVGGLRPGSCGG